MPRSRSRSRSPKRPERRRSRSKDRERDRDRQSHRRHRRSRSRDKGRRRSRERRHDRDTGNRHGGDSRGGGERDRRRQESSSEDELIFQPVDKNPVTEEDIQSMPEDEQELMRVMGFSGFDTTKDKQVVGNEHYSANICKKRRYRQYMNRKGGFNRPLDFIA